METRLHSLRYVVKVYSLSLFFVDRQQPSALNLRTACKGKLKPLLESAPNTTSKGLGPRAVLKTLDFSTKSLHEINRWREESRIAAITGSCSRSLQSVSSGVRCYMAFAGAFMCLWNSVFLFNYNWLSFAAETRPDRKVFLPPKIEDLMAWSVFFRSEGTFSNYVG